MTATGLFISRLPDESGLHNVIDARTVTVYFQRAPGLADGEDRGIGGLDFQVVSGGEVVQTGRTQDDGKIVVRMLAGRATLELLSGGATVASYEIRRRSEALEADDTIAGVQRRLGILGYQLGHESDEGDGITSEINRLTDRAILDFQVDQKAVFDGKVTGANRASLNASIAALKK